MDVLLHRFLFCHREWVDSASRGHGFRKQLYGSVVGPVGRQTAGFGLTECFIQVQLFWRIHQRGGVFGALNRSEAMMSSGFEDSGLDNMKTISLVYLTSSVEDYVIPSREVPE